MHIRHALRKSESKKTSTSRKLSELRKIRCLRCKKKKTHQSNNLPIYIEKKMLTSTSRKKIELIDYRQTHYRSYFILVRVHNREYRRSSTV